MTAGSAIRSDPDRDDRASDHRAGTDVISSAQSRMGAPDWHPGAQNQPIHDASCPRFEWRSRARGGYSRRLIDDRGSRPSAEVDPSVVRLLAQAHRWWRILRDEPPQWWWHRSRSPAWHVGRVHLHDIGASAREEHRQARHCDTLHWHRRGARAGCRACLTHRYGPDFAVRHCLSVNGSAESAIPCIERPPPRIQ